MRVQSRAAFTRNENHQIAMRADMGSAVGRRLEFQTGVFNTGVRRVCNQRCPCHTLTTLAVRKWKMRNWKMNDGKMVVEFFAAASCRTPK